MKHYCIFLLTILLALPLAGQVPEVIPPSYEGQYKRIERRIARTIKKESPDVILDPIESTPITPTFYALETGNWGPTYLGVNQRADEIRARARRNVVVFIFDTGGCYDHPYLNDYVWNDLGAVFTGEADCKDGHGHSTHVAGIVAGAAPDYPLGIARMIPVKLVPIKVLSNGGSGSFTGIVQGTRYANEKAADLIAKGWFVVYNYSLGGGSSYGPLEEAFKEAEALGVLINCAANGNTGQTPVNYPGSSIYTLGTAALAQSGSGVTRASYSSYGPETWGAAPGSSILSTWPGGGTRLLSGTSMATPHQAGLFAILASVYPTATAAQLKAHYIKYATDLGSPGRDEYYGYGAGLIDPLLDNAPDGSEPPPPPDEPTCTDGKQNGKETGVDCGGPDCPPCEVPEPEKPPYQKRVLPLELVGSYPIDWVRTATESRIKPPSKEEAESFGVSVTVDGSLHTFGASCYDMDAYSRFHTAGTTPIVITRISVEARSETTYDWEWKALEKNAREFFSNRSIGTPGTWDVYHTGAYLLYFLDYFASQEKPGFIYQDLKPLEIEFEWEGVMVVVTRDLIDYKGPKKD